MSDLLYTASNWGRLFHALPHNDALGAGSAGPGKSLVLLMDPLEQILLEHRRCLDKNHPYHLRWGSSSGWALHMRRTMPMLEQTISRSHKYFPNIDPDATYDRQKHTWTFKSGYKFQFGHCSNADDWENYQSAEFCVAGGTRIVMGDGSLKEIQDIVAGELVATLEGPRRVAATHAPGKKFCVSARVVRQDGTVVGEQIHPENHPVMTIDGWRPSQIRRNSRVSSPECGWPRKGGDAPWQSYISLLRARPETQAETSSQASVETGSSGSDGLRQAVQRPAPLTCRVALVSLESLLVGSCSAHANPRHDPAYGESATREPRDSQGDCPVCRGSCGGQLPVRSGNGQPCPLPQADAAEHSHDGCTSGGQDSSQARTRCLSGTYFHPYSLEERSGWADIDCASCEMTPVGWVDVFDLTVEHANHYITHLGIANRNSHLAYDELVQFDEEQYHNITSRLRSSDPLLMKMLKVRSCSNPFFKRESGVNLQVRDPHWVRKRYVDPAPKGGVTLKKTIVLSTGERRVRTRIYLPATLFDNPDKAFVDNYQEQLLDKPAHIRQAMLYGDWYVTPGSHYGDDWLKNVHVCAPFQIPSSWRCFRSMDWGYKSWSAIHWWAVDYDGNLIAIKEFSFRQMSAKVVARRVRDIEMAMGLWNRARNASGITGPADTQLWEERGESGKTKAQEFAEEGVGWLRADKKSRARNSQRFIERLKDRRSMVPGVMFFETCEHAIRTIPAIQSDPHDPEAPCEGGDDHWHDSVMYACAFASNKHVGMSRDRIVERDDEDADPEVKLDRGKLGYGSRVE